MSRQSREWRRRWHPTLAELMAYGAGWDSWLRPRWTCPYLPFTERRRCWLDGWQDARESGHSPCRSAELHRQRQQPLEDIPVHVYGDCRAGGEQQ